MSEKKLFSAGKLVFCSMCTALAVVAGMIRLYQFPFGGSVTLCSMLFITLPAWLYGVREGVLCGMACGLVQFFMNPCFLTVPQFFLDYVLAFSVMGVAGFFRNGKHGLGTGYIAAVICRWLVATAAGLIWVRLGYTAWDGWNPLPYSMAYNGAYIFSEMAVTLLLLAMPAVRSTFERLKNSRR